jgi:DNA repair protein RecN (Recombination protein N)
MLKSFSIKNYALIKELELKPSPGLNIITGETGAGKSIMLGAIGLLLGNRADTKVLFDQGEKCVIEGTFDISIYDLKKIFNEEELDYDNLCIIRREISPQNKSRAFINDTPVTLEVLKKIGEKLMDVHSQHETLLLGNNDFQIGIVDAYANNHSLVQQYRALYQEHKSLKQQYEDLLTDSEEAKKQLDYNSFQFNELNEAELKEGEQEQLEEELKRMENAEEIKSRLNQAITIFLNEDGAVVSNVQTVHKLFEYLSPFSPNYEALRARLAAALIELKDITDEIEKEEGAVEFGRENFESVQERLSRYYSLQKKHRVNSIAELIEIRDELEKKVSLAENMDEEVNKMKKKLEKLYSELLTKAGEISKTRASVLAKIKSELLNLLKEVGIPNASLEIRQDKIEPNRTGTDLISFLFSANKGVAPQELKNAASGGEFSRLMLCLKYVIASKASMPTIVFDEIDTGISGEIAIKVGKMMKQMAKKHQVISISHLPQIAAQGDAHYFVYKDNSSARAVSRMKELSQEERVKEIAQMIGGAKPSETAIKSAKELLSLV